MAATRDTDVLDAPGAKPAALRGGAMRAGGYALGMALSIVSAPILLHHLGVRGFGRYTTVTALIGLVGTGTEAGLASIALREYATQEGQRRTLIMRHLLGIRLAITAAGVLIAMLFGLAAGYDHVRELGILAAGTGLILSMTQTLLAVPLQAGLRFGRATALDLLRQTTAVLGIVALALAGATLGPFFLVPILAGVVTLGATVAIVRTSMPLRPTVTPRAWGQLLRDTVPFAVATAIYAAYFRVAIIVMSVRASAIETGFFATSYRVVEVLITVPAIAVTAAFPLLARAERDDAARFERATVRMAELAFIGGTFTALALVLSAPLIVDLLTPPEGHPATAVLRLQAPAMIATFVSVACTFGLLALRRHRAILVANAVALVAVVILAVGLVDAHAARGAAVATTLAEFLLAGTIVALLHRELPAVWSGLLRTAPAVVLASAAGAAILAVPGLPALADTAMGLSVFAAVLALAGRWPSELREMVRWS